MPALSTPVSDFVNSVKLDLITAPAIGYLRAQDFATILELFQEAVSPTAAVTATAGSTTTATVAAAGVANSLAGARVVFGAATATVALRGVEAYVVSNTTTVLTFDRVLPGAVANTDTFALTQGLVAREIQELREGLSRADAPRGSIYGNWRTVASALQRMSQQLAAASLPVKSMSRAGLVTAAGSTDLEIKSVDSDMKIDGFKGFHLTIAGETRRIVRNSEDTFLLSKALTSAPAAAIAFSIAFDITSSDVFPGHFNMTQPGGHPDSIYVAYLLGVVQAIVVAYTVPA